MTSTYKDNRIESSGPEHLTRPFPVIMLRRMSITSMFNVRIVSGFVLAVAALVTFNIARPNFQSELEASFNEWYQTTSKVLESSDRTVAPTVTVRVRLSGALTNMSTSDWAIPSAGYATEEDRQRVARILQLIHASGVFHLRPVSTRLEGRAYITIAISEGERAFETTIPFDEATNNIQLQNLLKLLEVFHTTQPPAVNPTQL